MKHSETQQEPVPTGVEIRHQQEPDQFRHLLDAAERLRATCDEQDSMSYLRDNFFVLMSAAAQEAKSSDHDVRNHAYNTPHQLTYMQLLRSIAEAGMDYQKGLSGVERPTVYHAMFLDIQDQAQHSENVPSETHNLQRHLSLAALHMRVIHENQDSAAIADLGYRYAIEEQVITPLAKQTLQSDRIIHPNLVDAHDQPEALSVLVRAIARFSRSDELPNLV